MASSSNSQNEVDPPSPGISSFQCMMKKQNEEILANEDDNRSSSQKHNVKVSSRKRDKPKDESEHKNEYSNPNKRPRVSGASLPEPELELGQVVEPPASFNTLDDDCLGNVLDFVGKKCYSVFGRVNKRCHEMFCSKGLPKETYLYGYGPLHIIQQQQDTWYHPGLSKGVLHFNRRDILDWIFIDESDEGYRRLKSLCSFATKESRLDILREVFQKANERQLEYLRDCHIRIDLCGRAARYGKLECLKLLRQNECEWDHWTWKWAKDYGHEHILQYLRDNDYPTYWQVARLKRVFYRANE